MQLPFIRRTTLQILTISWFMACLVMPGGLAAQDTPAAQEQATRFQDFAAFEAAVARDGNTIALVSTGELTGLGPAEAVLITHSDPHSGLLERLQLVVLAADGMGRLRVVGRTPDADAPHDVTTSMRIERGSLFVQLDALRGAWGTYQFKQQAEGGLRLIGIRLHRADNSGPPDFDEIAEVDTDFNLVTGNMQFERAGDSRPLKAHVKGPSCFLDRFDFDFYYCANHMQTVDGTSAADLMNTP